MALALVCALASAQTVRVKAPAVVAADEQFTVSFTIDGEKAPKEFSWSPGDDFQLVWGPQKGTSSSIQIINGKTTRSSQTTYTYVLLPRATGRFTLAPAVANFGKDKEVASQSVTIEVPLPRRASPLRPRPEVPPAHPRLPQRVPSPTRTSSSVSP